MFNHFELENGVIVTLKRFSFSSLIFTDSECNGLMLCVLSFSVKLSSFVEASKARMSFHHSHLCNMA